VSAPADRAQSLLQFAHQALGRGAWEDARRGFTDALAEQEGPEALEGLGLAAWWLDDAAAVFDARERAYRLYVARRDRRGAGRVAMSLAQDAIYFRGQPAIARGWLAALAVLVIGILAGDDVGLSAVVLILVLFTVYFASRLIERLAEQRS